jgi:hypothetical protein
LEIVRATITKAPILQNKVAQQFLDINVTKISDPIAHTSIAYCVGMRSFSKFRKGCKNPD